jgi:putative transferase (TIGR04331 family)
MMCDYTSIRATALENFWGDEYSNYLYLWEGSKSNLCLADIINAKDKTLGDNFSTQEEIQKGHEYCREFYYRILPILAEKLNAIHGVNESTSFWQISFGYWLYRHISIIYEKFVQLGRLDLNKTSIKLLRKDDYYTPKDHVDYISCFANDFGVQQLVSLYYSLYADKKFKVLSQSWCFEGDKPKRKFLRKFVNKALEFIKPEPRVGLMGVYLSKKTVAALEKASVGLISTIELPVIEIVDVGIYLEKRKFISGNGVAKTFEDFFMQSLYNCLPKDLIENFSTFYEKFSLDVQRKKITAVVSEEWISNIAVAIYVAISKKNSAQFIAHEHGAGSFYYKNCLHFVDCDVSDVYLTTGWIGGRCNIVKGGFSCRDIVSYQHEPRATTILFITRTKFLYWEEFNEYNATNSTFINELTLVNRFIDLLPLELRANFKFRPRRAQYLWDVEFALETDARGLKIDRGDFSRSISNAKIVIIDHISTGFAEIILKKIPFILIYNVEYLSLEGGLLNIFTDLKRCGVVHESAESAAAHLLEINDNVDNWWNSEAVSRPINELTQISLAPSALTTDYLLSLVATNAININYIHKLRFAFFFNIRHFFLKIRILIINIWAKNDDS